MKLSVIIPSFNRATTLSRAIDSVLNQKLTIPVELETIVVDDGSTDESAQLVQQYETVQYRYQQNQGVSSARNVGIERAQGEWLAFLDSDDEWLPQKLLLQFERLLVSGHQVSHTEEIWIRNGVRVNQMNKHQKSGGQIYLDCLPLCAMSPSSIIIHRQVFEQVGTFDESLPACEDYDLWLRIASQFEVDFIAEPCIKKYGGHDDQLSRKHWGMDRFRVRALDKMLRSDIPLSEQQRVATKNTLREKLIILRNGAQKRDNQELIEYCTQKLQQYQITD